METLGDALTNLRMKKLWKNRMLDPNDGNIVLVVSLSITTSLLTRQVIKKKMWKGEEKRVLCRVA